MRSLKTSALMENRALAALCHFFDALVARHAATLISFATVRRQKYSFTEGKTAETRIEQARKLLNLVGIATPMDLRDRAVLDVSAFTGICIGGIGKLRLSHYRNTGEQRTPSFREKSGKDREIPVRHNLRRMAK